MVKLNVGCGKRNFGPNWVHIDSGNYHHATRTDVTLGNWESNSVDLIYASHLIAYFNRDKARELLRSWFDVLKPGGVLQIATPDAMALCDLYAVNTNVGLDNILGPLYGKMQMGNEIIYHKTIWDFQSLKNLLVEIGFVDVDTYDHRTTCHPNTGNRDDYFDDHSSAYINGTLISLNVQATKPSK